MEYRLKIDGETLPVTCETGEENTLQLSADGEDFDVRWAQVSPHQLHLTVNGRGVSAYVADGPDGKTVIINGAPYPVQDADAPEQKVSRKKSGDDLPKEITPPMPAVVVRILVEEGETVEKGQGVVVVSAMKMETTLNAPYAGRVTKINTAEGDKVAVGQILADFEESGEAA